jgi:peptidoglycan/xylan/chitin deacetylase (PgdA/CDA1 family)
MSNKKLKISITIDTEFSINHAFQNPYSAIPKGKDHVLCPVDSINTGLPFLLSTFKNYNITATFYIEALQCAYFGLNEMGQFIPEILNDKHEIGLHIHPCWLTFLNKEWQKDVISNPNDSCANLSDYELDAILNYAKNIFKQWNINKISSIRTGSLKCDTNTLRAFARHNILLSSTLGIGYFKPHETLLHLVSGHKHIETVLEMPILTYQFLGFPFHKDKILTITGTNFDTICYLLNKAHQIGYHHIILLTHPFEFITKKNRIRLEKLCAYIQNNSHRFEAHSIESIGNSLFQQGDFIGSKIKIPFLKALRLILENKF